MKPMAKPFYIIKATNKATGAPAGFVQLFPGNIFPKPSIIPNLGDTLAAPASDPLFTVVPNLSDATQMSLPEVWAVVQINRGFTISVVAYDFTAQLAGTFETS
jgi:hypothetical protein